jgi:tetratricopeptide (TPR) repeat protein
MVGDPKWGGLARRAAGRIGEGGSGASATWRDAMDRARADRSGEHDPRQTEQWVQVEEVRDEATSAVKRGRRREVPSGAEGMVDAALEQEIRTELAQAVGSGRAPRLEQRLADGSRAFRGERYTDAARILRKLVEEAPGVASARELYGLTLYRQGKWRAAVRQLEAFRLITGSTEQHPVLADCYRALGDDQRVEELWSELRESSPSAELVFEGRIVMAGTLADRGDLQGAIRLLEQGWKLPRRPQEHHLRRGYALADLYERAGDLARARELFSRLADVAPDFADVRERVRALA